MFHDRRTWCVVPVETPEELAERLTEHSWCLCCGFEIQGYLFLNDALSEDGAQEYAVVRRPTTDGEDFLQVESITFSWCSKSDALQYVYEAVGGDFALSGGRVVHPNLETPQVHDTCRFCA